MSKFFPPRRDLWRLNYLKDYGPRKSSILPKSWLYWCRKAGIKPDYPRGSTAGYYMTGRGRRWRVTCYGDFEVSCPNEHFDRWANSGGSIMTGLPKTEAEFMAAVQLLHHESKDRT